MTVVAYAALWIFAFAVPWDRLVVVPGESIVTKVTGILALVLALFAIVLSGRVRRWRAFHITALLFLVWTGVVSWFVQAGSISQKIYTFIQLFVMVWMMWEIAPSPERLRGLFAAYVFGAWVPAIGTILLYLRHRGGAGLGRYAAGGADANALSMTLALAFPLAWYLASTTERPLWRWVFRAYLPLGIFAAALTGSRGGMVAWLVALLVIPLSMSLSPGRLAAAVGLLGLTGALVVAYVPDRVVQRLSSTSSAIETHSFGGRFQFWKAGLHAFEARPLMGYGPGAFVAAITPEVGPQALVAHNSFLSVLVEEGIIGLALFVAMLWSVFVSLLSLRGLDRRFALVLMATLGISLLPLTWEHRKPVWFIAAALVGWSTVRSVRRVAAIRQSASVGGVRPRAVPARGAGWPAPVATQAGGDDPG